MASRQNPDSRPASPEFYGPDGVPWDSDYDMRRMFYGEESESEREKESWKDKKPKPTGKHGLPKYSPPTEAQRGRRQRRAARKKAQKQALIALQGHPIPDDPCFHFPKDNCLNQKGRIEILSAFLKTNWEWVFFDVTVLRYPYTLIRTYYQLDEICCQLLADPDKLVGFDAEFLSTRCAFDEWQRSIPNAKLFPVMTVEAAGEFVRFIQMTQTPGKASYVIDIWQVFHSWLDIYKLTDFDGNAFKKYGCQRFLPQSFMELIESEDVIKVGHGLQNDAEALMRTFGLKLKGTLDTQTLWVEEFASKWCRGGLTPALVNVFYHITGQLVKQELMPEPDVLIKLAKLDQLQYGYCARDPALPLALLSIFGYCRQGSYCPLKCLKEEFERSIVSGYDYKYEPVSQHILYRGRELVSVSEIPFDRQTKAESNISSQGEQATANEDNDVGIGRYLHFVEAVKDADDTLATFLDRKEMGIYKIDYPDKDSDTYLQKATERLRDLDLSDFRGPNYEAGEGHGESEEESEGEDDTGYNWYEEGGFGGVVPGAEKATSAEELGAVGGHVDPNESVGSRWPGHGNVPSRQRVSDSHAEADIYKMDESYWELPVTCNYGWRRITGSNADFPEDPTYDTVAAPYVAWEGRANSIVHPRFIDLLRCRSREKAIEEIRKRCPDACMSYFKKLVVENANAERIVAIRDWTHLGRQLAMSMRLRVTPLLFYAWFLSAKGFAQTMSQGQKKNRGRGGKSNPRRQ